MCPVRNRPFFDKERRMELFKNAKFDFVEKKWWFILPSLAIIIAGFVSIVAQGGLRYSIDFKGGTQMQVRWDGIPPVNKIRAALASRLKIGRASCKGKSVDLGG